MDENLLFHGDNLQALKILIDRGFTKKIKCCYIDPPYNTCGGYLKSYNDHQQKDDYYSFMSERLKLLWQLLTKGGSIWISISDKEVHYLKVFCDKLFGKNNFISTVVWQKKLFPINHAKYLSCIQEYILVYVKDRSKAKAFNFLPIKTFTHYINHDNDKRGEWITTIADSYTNSKEKNFYPIKSPSGKVFYPREGRCWKYIQSTMEERIADNRIWWGKSGDAFPRIKTFLSEKREGVVAMTWWTSQDVGTTAEGCKESKVFNPDNPFPTAKPERLIKKILFLATNEGDLVIDVFGGSGTTPAVAQKMQRRWICAEETESVNTHIIPRLRMIDEDCFRLERL